MAAARPPSFLAVDRLGSIQRAAEEFGMSYRHAWGAIKKIEKRAGFKILDRKLGGKEGGARLTPKGKEFIGKVDSLFQDLKAIVEERFNQNFQENHPGRMKSVKKTERFN